jgi:two-component system, NarL family, response regulator LiaR
LVDRLSTQRLRGGEAMTIQVLVTDDHKVVRRGLRGFLELDPELEVVGEASNGAEAMDMARLLEPDVVLMDLLMPVMDGIEATGAIRRELPDVEVIALTSVLEDVSVSEAVRAGAIGYLLKNTEAEALGRAIKAAADGQVQLAPEAAARLMREVRSPESPEALTEREAEVLRLVARGWANKQIAQELFVGEKTVKAHVSSILTKLGVHSRTQAALHAVRIGLVSMNELNEESW